jgi:predicted RNA-binding protein with PIN domain
MAVRLVVDGYNVVHAWRDLRELLETSLELARDRLIGRLSVYRQVTGEEVTVVFDAHRTAALRDREELRDGVRVVFSRSGRSADHVIERLAYRARDAGEPLLVATSDGFQRDMVRGVGGAVIDAAELERRVSLAEAEMERAIRRHSR